MTASGSKSYIFQADLYGKTIRITICDSRSKTVKEAQTETIRLKTLTDRGIDSRQQVAEKRTKNEAAIAAQKAQETRETMTVSTAWNVYLEYQKDKMQYSHIERGKHWDARQDFEMFRAFWRWCASRPEYSAVIDLQAVESKDLRDEIPSRKSKQFDVLQRAHLPAWFAAVRSLNPINGYLGCCASIWAR